MSHGDLHGLIFLSTFQAPLFISFFFALKHMSVSYPSFKTGGALWFTDLSVADPFYLLPTVSALSMLAALELGADTGQAMAQQKASMKLFFRGFSLFMVPSLIMAGIPNGVFMYWISANSFSLAQVLILQIPGVKQALGIPALPKPAPPPASAESLAPRIPAAVYSTRPSTKPVAHTPSPAQPLLHAARPGAKGVRVKRSKAGSA